MGSMAQTGLLLVPSDALGHTWALPGVLGAGQGLPSETGMGDLKSKISSKYVRSEEERRVLANAPHSKSVFALN